MRKKISILFGVFVWFSVVTQFYLMIENRTAPITETIIRFFSFFTILTNALVAVYFTNQIFKLNRLSRAGTLTAITVYITIVGAVYQVLLRHIWQPAGLQKIIDELLHTINPILMILFWYLFEEKTLVKYRQIISWLVYPVVYLIYILIRGNFSGFYPYPFINVTEIGLSKTLINSGALLLFFAATAFILVFLGKQISKRNLLPM